MNNEKNYGKDAFLLATELEDKLEELNSRMLYYDTNYAKIIKVNYSGEIPFSGNLTLNLGKIDTNNEIVCAIIAFKINEPESASMTASLTTNSTNVSENIDKSQKSILIVDNITTDSEAELKVNLTYSGSATTIQNINLMLVGTNIKFNKNQIVV